MFYITRRRISDAKISVLLISGLMNGGGKKKSSVSVKGAYEL